MRRVALQCKNGCMTMQQTEQQSMFEFDLADRMRRTLRVSGVTAQEIADYLGVSRTSVSNWINGRVTPSRQTLMLWALATEYPLSWLESGVEPDPSEPTAGIEPATYSLVVADFSQRDWDLLERAA